MPRSSPSPAPDPAPGAPLSVGRGSASATPLQEVSDEALNGMILTRLTLLGVDLSVLPVDEPDAPVDQRRILESARRFLRSTPSAIADFEMDPQEVPPVMYPAAVPPVADVEPGSAR